MKIISGKYGRRVISRPKTDATRPMSDKVREALFSVVGSVDGLQVLDVYAGSGALALEALSRGAAAAVAVESSKTAVKTIVENQKILGIGEALNIKAMTVAKALNHLEGQTFELIIADPPYERINYEELARLASLLAFKGLLIVSHTSRIALPQLESMERTSTRTYGDTSLSFYKKKTKPNQR
jgi:16S rRNA (guanine966-N2)-methyltransferase